MTIVPPGPAANRFLPSVLTAVSAHQIRSEEPVRKNKNSGYRTITSFSVLIIYKLQLQAISIMAPAV
jgi:hypothetical protein